MRHYNGTFLRVLCLYLLLLFSPPSSAAARAKQIHIVYMGARPTISLSSCTELKAVHLSHLASAVGSEHEAAAAHLYSYTKSFNGFSAILDADHVEAIKQIPGVVSVFPSQKRTLATTRSWEFLGLRDSPRQGLWPESNYGRGVILGLIDSGIWPESSSFRDDHMPLPPAKWKGVCESGELFNSSNCNRKLVGARYFLKGFASGGNTFEAFRSPRDDSGHGSHTASTAVGRLVMAGESGLATGVARGGAPLAHVAVYKACWGIYVECDDSDLLAAIDAAVDDGVDVLSMSVQNTNPQPKYDKDTMAIGTFHAIAKGIFVVAAAGNAGEDGPSTASNLAPWITTVAASSLDRIFTSQIIASPKGPRTTGTLLTTFTHVENWLPRTRKSLVYGGSIPSRNATSDQSKYCNPAYMDISKLNGSQVLLCEFHQNSFNTNFDLVHIAGIIFIGSLTSKIVENNFLRIPAVDVEPNVGAQLRLLAQAPNSSAYVIISPPKTDAVRYKPAPLMAKFSSNGPNSLSPTIIKPDITAPGMHILAAYSPGASRFGGSVKPLDYALMSGTSMACPHVAGVAVLLKALHPMWSPAAIRSAIMTSATHVDNTGQILRNTLLEPSGPFSYGSGIIQPIKAADPGLIYDLEVNDYLGFLCKDGYNTSTFVNSAINCSLIQPHKDLNYPSIASTVSNSINISRTVTNVGPNIKATYKVKIQAPKEVEISVVPHILSFQHLGEKIEFNITFNVKEDTQGRYVFGWITWEDGIHVVNSPLALIPVKQSILS